MSLSRQFLRELRPFVRMFDEAFSRPTSLSGFPATAQSLFSDPFFRTGLSQPAVDLLEAGNKYIVEAELPGVKKENLSLSLGENGRSLTIEGCVVETSSTEPQGATSDQPNASASADKNSQAVVANQPNQLTSERSFVRNSSFSRTIWLPRPVDGNSVEAKLANGVLIVELQKAEDKGRIDVPIQ